MNKGVEPAVRTGLVPLGVLALPRWRLVLAWMAVYALLWVLRMYYDLTPANKGLPPDWFLGAAVVRDLMVVLIAVLVVRTIIQPETDPVRLLDGEDDPGLARLDDVRAATAPCSGARVTRRA